MEPRRSTPRVRVGQVLLVPTDTLVWWNRSPEEVEDIYRRLPPLDDAGEPRLVSSIGSRHLDGPATAMVLRSRGVPWSSWTQKPRGLVEVLLTEGTRPPAVVMLSTRSLGLPL